MLRFTDRKCCARARIVNILDSEIQSSVHTEAKNPARGMVF